MGNFRGENTGNQFVKGRKQEALAEIEGWVGGSREEIIKAGAARVASHPPKNITEQKMLDSHLYDMSRQRFNFIAHCQWEKKLFLEKQRRKTAVMRDLLRNVNISNLPQTAFSLPRRRGGTKGEQSKKDQSVIDNISSRKSLHDPDVFVTHNFSRSLEHNSTISALQDEYRSRRTHTLTATTIRSDSLPTIQVNTRIWPLNDIRYTRLNEVLCDNYPKIVHLQPRRKRPNARLVTDFKR